MTEEEIIDYLKESIEHSEYNFENFGEHNYLDVSTINAISKLLDLYNKQKEEIEEEKEKWKELFHEYNKLVGEVIDKEQDLKDSISKDKIREIFINKRNEIIFIKNRNERLYKVKILDEIEKLLLEEE